LGQNLFFIDMLMVSPILPQLFHSINAIKNDAVIDTGFLAMHRHLCDAYLPLCNQLPLRYDGALI
jgi:hypothetical protein